MKTYFLVLSFFYLLYLSAQNTSEHIQNFGTVKGWILDSTNKQPLEYVNLMLFRENDSSKVHGTITNEKGAFILEKVPLGHYYIKISFMGYNSRFISGIFISAKKSTIHLGNIFFKLSASSLKEVIITADKPMITYGLDKKVIDVEKNITSTGGTAVDVLRNIPSVTVDADNNVSLRGQSNINILLNGRPSGMTGTKLDQIPASSIENIEIITNPSAKYNPDGMSGIINIKLKKKKTMGFNGMITVGAATGDKYNGSVNINYNMKKINLFASYDFRNDRRKGWGDLERTTDLINDTSSLLIQHSKTYRKNSVNNMKLGLDYFINPKNTITFQGIFDNHYKTNYDHTDANNSLFRINNPNPDLSIYNSYIFEPENNNDFDYSMNYKKTFDKKGKELTADLIYCNTNGFENENVNKQYYYLDTISNTLIKNGDPIIQGTHTLGKYSSGTFQLNFVNPLKNPDSKYEAGLQAIYTNTDDDFKFSNYEISQWTENKLRANHFIYTMQIYSAYGLYANTYKNFNFQLGLRLENAFTKAEQKTSSQVFNKNYFSFFPSLHINRELNKTTEVQISYSRRINRPNGEALNPFIDYSHPESIHYGNPQLKPEYINSFELGGMKKIKKTTINTDLFYRQINDVIKRIITIDSQRISHMTYQNLSTGISYGIDFIAEQQLLKFWKLNANFSYFRTIIKGDKENTNLTNDNYSWTAKMSSNMMLPKKFFFQITGFYNGPMVTPQGKIKEMYSLDAALKKDLWKDKATISLRLSDIFNTLKFRINTYGDGFNADMIRKRETRILYLTFTYRINGGIKQKPKSKDENGKMPFDEGY